MKVLNLPAVGVALLSLGFGLSGCGGGGGGGAISVANAPSETPQGTPAALAASKPGELLAFVKDKLRERQKQRLADPYFGYPIYFALVTTNSVAGEDSTKTAVSTTTVQEQGVDEDDLLKTDGTTIVALSPQNAGFSASRASQLQLHRRLSDGKAQLTGTLDLPATSGLYETVHGMYFAPEAAGVAVISESLPAYGDLRPCLVGAPCPVPLVSPSRVYLNWVNVTNPAAPAVSQSIKVDGHLVGSRQIGNALVLVTTLSPVLAVDILPATATDAEREAALAKLSIADVLPKVSVNGAAPQALLPDTDCYLQTKNASLSIDITTIIVIDLKSPTLARTSRCFVGGTEALYMSPASIYLTTTRYAWALGQSLIRFMPQATTDVHKFSLTGLTATYRGSGEVPGHLGWDVQKKPYRMGEYQGDLRILTFTGEVGWVGVADASVKTTPASPATLTILRERSSDQSLQMVGQLPNSKRPAPLGLAGEQVYAVRLLGERGYVVTFRQVDPLYVLDLSDPTDPRTVGELKMPGYSDYLFPIEGGLLLGMGKDATAEGRLGGVKMALFDVVDPAKPKELAVQSFGERGSTTALDYSSHGVNMLMRGNSLRIALPMALRQAATSTSTSSLVQGLQRFEVDTRARTLQTKPMLPSSVNQGDVSTERSVQIGDQVYYLSQGRLLASDW